MIDRGSIVTRFTPDDPGATHERFERVRERVLRRLDESLRSIKRAAPNSTKRSPWRSKKIA